MAILLIRLQFFENLLNVSYLHESLLLACSASNNVLAGRSKDSFKVSRFNRVSFIWVSSALSRFKVIPPIVESFATCCCL